LHSTDFSKDTHTFTDAFVIHRERNGDNFADFVFPGKADFSRTVFRERADFSRATFIGETDFRDVTFSKETSFSGAVFREKADFGLARFYGQADFHRATFSKKASFMGVIFSEAAIFDSATFSENAVFSPIQFNKEAFFSVTTFSGEVDFGGAEFSKEANFNGAIFSGRTLFAGRETSTKTFGYIFADAEVDFTEVTIQSPESMTFQHADLMKCLFRETDLRKVQLVGIKWPGKSRRVCLYDEFLLVQSGEMSVESRSEIERLYRQLKQNYEDRRDYERAGDFHYGEKEMRRQNPDTTWGLRLFLTLYWLFSGYGERYLRPLLWAGVLFASSTIGYMWWGLRPKAGGASLAWVNVWDWLRAAHYSFRVMTLLKPDDWVPLRYAQLVNTVQTLLGPTFLGLFALALRQRLKR
jgi:uncharacterized protein YjbI with pentapeptide repeats